MSMDTGELGSFTSMNVMFPRIRYLQALCGHPEVIARRRAGGRPDVILVDVGCLGLNHTHVPEPELATYNRLPSGVMTAVRLLPT